MNDIDYKFDAEETFVAIRNHWTEWTSNTNTKKWIVGISGGKDSTVVAGLACKIFGSDNVIGVLLPCNGQKDIEDSYKIVKFLGIKSHEIEIGDCYDSIVEQIEENCEIKMNDTAKVNLSPRLRMSVLYAVAQSYDGMVVNTSNFTERVLGYETLFGDSAGSYSPLGYLTVTEVIALGKHIGLPTELVEKTPADGLQEKSDEDKLGLRYSDVDKIIRGIDSDRESSTYKKTFSFFLKNSFKWKMTAIDGPKFENLPFKIY